MNGLEAIKLMEQGKMISVKMKNDEVVVTKIENGKVFWSFDYELEDNNWKEEDSFDFTLKYEEYNPKPLTGWERVDTNNGKYYSISCEHVTFFNDCDEKFDSRMINNANYFSTKEKAEEIDFKQTLFRKLQRFSDENGGGDIDWNDLTQNKYIIHYDSEDKEFKILSYTYLKNFGGVYFVSYEVIEKAIETFKDDLIKYFTM